MSKTKQPEKVTESVVVEKQFDAEKELEMRRAQAQFEQIIIDNSQNRRTRRAFKKRFGTMLPPMHFPHIKAMKKECKCDNCKELYAEKPEDK